MLLTFKTHHETLLWSTSGCPCAVVSSCVLKKENSYMKNLDNKNSNNKQEKKSIRKNGITGIVSLS